MAESIILESFVTAIACLCASSYGPNTNPDSLKYNIADSLSTWDQDVLQIFLNSNHKFNFATNSENCMLPDTDSVHDRLYALETGAGKLQTLINELKKDLDYLSFSDIRNEEQSDKLDMQDMRSKIVQLNKDIEEKDQTITELREENNVLRALAYSTTTTTTTQRPPSPSPPPETNSCVDKSHGVNKLKICHEDYVFCDKSISSRHGEGWLLFARRINGYEHFYRNWSQYTKGFGKFKENEAFFLGLKLLHKLTTSKPHELLIILTDKENITRYAHYDSFLIGNENERFALKQLGKYDGDAGDSLTYHAGQKFTTFDNDNDSNPNDNCASMHTGAWWYKDCHRSNLFGLHRNRRSKLDPHISNGMIWGTFHNTNDGSLNTMRMLIKPKEKTLSFY